MFTIPESILEVVHVLRRAGHEAFLVGGCVRDLLLERTPKDFDVVTSAVPDVIESLFSKTLPLGKAFGIIQVLCPDGTAVDVATFRTDSPESDGRRPQSVATATAEEDALRRDFTINALLMNPDTGGIMDYTGQGEADLQQRVIRAIGDPATRFTEDGLRMLRAIRFAGTLDFQIETQTFRAIQAHTHLLNRISPERIQQELSRMLTESVRPGDTVQCLLDSGLLQEFMPEVAAMAGVEQPPEFHPEGDVFTHTTIMLNMLPPHPSLTLALAVLLHDVGKPPTANLITLPDGRPRWRFECHASVGADMARRILSRLRYPLKVVDTVTHMVGQHMKLAEAGKMRPAKLRRLLGAPTFDEELELHRVDCASSHGLLDIHEFLKQQREAFQNEPVLPPPLVTGKLLIARGYVPSPAFAGWLQQAYDRQLEGETDVEALLALIPPPTVK